jgi:hypothetical protein
LAYTWFSGVFASLTGTAGTAVTATTNEMATQFKIEAARYDSATARTNITIRNIGTQIINAAQSAVYIAGAPATYTSVTVSSIGQYGTSVIYGITNSTAVCGNIIVVTIGTGTSDSRTVSC